MTNQLGKHQKPIRKKVSQRLNMSFTKVDIQMPINI